MRRRKKRFFHTWLIIRYRVEFLKYGERVKKRSLYQYDEMVLFLPQLCKFKQFLIAVIANNFSSFERSSHIKYSKLKKLISSHFGNARDFSDLTFAWKKNASNRLKHSLHINFELSNALKLSDAVYVSHNSQCNCFHFFFFIRNVFKIIYSFTSRNWNKLLVAT